MKRILHSDLLSRNKFQSLNLHKLVTCKIKFQILVLTVFRALKIVYYGSKWAPNNFLDVLDNSHSDILTELILYQKK